MYRADLATIHHEGFGDWVRGAAPALLGYLEASGIEPGSLVVDLGCGSGIWLARLTRAGYRGAGIERSSAMARIARRVAPGVPVRVASIHRATIPKCAAVTALGEVLSYLPAPSLDQTFRRIARSLDPGGLFIFDLLVRRRAAARYRTWTAGPAWLVCVEVEEDRASNRLVRTIEVFRREATGGRYRRDRERHRVRVVGRRDVVAALTRAGFRTKVRPGYGPHRLAAGRLAFVATLTSPTR